MNPKYIITLLLLLLCSGTASAAWANTSYTNAKNITLLGTDTQLTNYPYLVSVAKESAMQSDYDDLIFYDQPVWSSGNLIEFEIETYNATVATIWLNITTLPTAGKTVSVYYGNAVAVSTQNSNATWNSDYVGVWHMSDNLTTTYAWNDYKQPDGVITANASQYYILAEQSVYYEDSKFKAWMRERYAPGIDYFGYWESTNGYDWNEIKADCLGSAGTSADRCRHPFMMQDPNSTGYWLYNFNASTNKEDLYYGTNETNWSIDTYGIFSAADVGASLIGNVFVWRENTSDWYALVENNGPTWTSDYATSNDGKSWTFHGQVTVSGFGTTGLSGPWIHKNNGTYYMLFHGNHAVTGGIPSDIYVATCTDRQSWVYQSGFEILRDQSWEGAGEAGGQCGDPHPAEYNGELYIFYQGGRTQAPDATDPLRTGLCHLNESLQEVCDHIAIGTSNGVAADSTTYTRDGTLTDITTSTNGAIGSCMGFDGDSSYIDLGTTLNLPTGTHSFWFNTTSISAAINQAYSHNNMSGNTPVLCTRIKDITGAKVDVNVGGVHFAYGSTSANNWYKVDTISNASGNDVFYLNGYEIDNKAHDAAHAGDVSGWVFGTIRTKSSGWYIGTLDEGRVSDVVRSADWINISYQMIVDSSYVSFGAEETYGASTNDITLAANKYGLLRRNVSSSETFSTIASGFTHDVCYTWFNSTSDGWESHWVGDSYNSDKSIPQNDSYFVMMDGTGETVSCGVASAGTIAIPSDWSMTYLRESTSYNLTTIKADMGANVTDLYAWNHTASGTGAWIDTGTYSVLPNQGLLVNSSQSFNWDGSI